MWKCMWKLCFLLVEMQHLDLSLSSLTFFMCYGRRVMHRFSYC